MLSRRFIEVETEDWLDQLKVRCLDTCISHVTLSKLWY